MDGQVIDQLSRIWASAADRRRVLRLLGAGVLTASWLRRGQDAVAQVDEAQETCAQDADCQDGDANPCSGAACLEGVCTFFIVDCIAGTICCGNGECCPVEASGNCTADADCAPTMSDPCRDAMCVNGTCLAQRMTCPPDQFCHLGSCVPIGPTSISMP